MKLYKIAVITILTSLITISCKSLEVKKIEQIADFPKTLKDIDSSDAQISKLKVANYFSDPKLVALYEKAIANNLDFKIAQQRVAIANIYLKATRLQQLPSLDLAISASGNRYGNHTIEGVGNYDTNLSPNITEDQKVNRDFTPNYFVGLQSSWEIDVWGKFKNKKVAAQRKFLSSQEGLKLLQTELLTSVATLYFELVALDQERNIYIENNNLQQRAFEIIQAQRVVGKATELAVQQFKAQNKKMEAAILEIDIQILETEKALRTLVGDYDGKIDRSSSFSVASDVILHASINVTDVLNNRPDVKADWYNLQAAYADAKSIKAAFYPNVGLSGSVGYNAFSTEMLFKPSSLATQLVGGLMMPIFNRGQLKQQFNIAKSEQEIAFFSYQKSITSAYNELQAVVSQLHLMDNVLKLKSEEVDHMELATQISHDLYLTGYANYLELISTRKDKLQADLDLLQMKKQKSNYSILLFKALGGEL